MQLEIRTLLSGPVFDDDCKKQIRGDLERFYAPRCKQPNFLSKDFLRLGIPPIDWKSKVGSFQRGLTLKRRALFYRAAYYMPIFEGEMKKTFALRPNPPGACGAWGVWRNAKVFLPQKVFYEKTKKMKKKTRKNPILDHFRESEKQISPFSYTLHMSILLQTSYKNMKSNDFFPPLWSKYCPKFIFFCYFSPSIGHSS